MSGAILPEACACPSASAESIARAAACFASDRRPCTHHETSAATSFVAGLHCLNATYRGFFVLSRDSAGSPVCTGGDSYHLRAVERQDKERFASLSQAVFASASGPLANVYWLSASAASLRGGHAYVFTISLVETQHRALQLTESLLPARWSVRTSSDREGGLLVDESPLHEAIRTRKCAWERVPLPATTVVMATGPVGPSSETEPPCSSLPARKWADWRRQSYVRLLGEARRDATAVQGSCGPWCAGDAMRSIFDTSNPARWRGRRHKGYGHVLKPSGCMLRLFDEAAMERCLAGRSVLLMGSAYSVALLRGFAHLNSSIAAWTRTRPGPVHPNVADFWRAYEKPSGSYCYRPGRKPSACAIRFGGSVVHSASFHYPEWSGLANLRPTHHKQMCAVDVLVFESGVEDVGLPVSRLSPQREKSVLLEACLGQPAASCNRTLASALRNQSWRLMPLSTYVKRLRRLLAVWAACRRQRPTWRGIFKLAAAPRPRGLHETRRAADCARGARGYATVGAHILQLNRAARLLVEAAGFEVFDPFGATAHAAPEWFDPIAGPLEYDDSAIEPIDDLLTQMLANQLCGPAPGEADA